MQKRKYIPLLSGSFYVSFYIGLFSSIRGILLPAIKDHFNINHTETAVIILTFLIPGVGGCLYSGYIFNKYNKKKLLLGGGIIVSTFTLLLPFSLNYNIFLFVSFLIGFGIILVELGSQIAVPLVLHNSKYKEAGINVIHFMFSLGSVLVLVIFTLVPENTATDWQSPYLVVGLASLIIPVTFSASLFPNVRAAQTKENYSLKYFITLFRDPQMIRYLILISFYSGAEIGLTTWLPMFYEKGYNKSTQYVSTVLLGFFIFLTIGRLTGSLISRKLNNHRLVISLMIGAIISIITGILLRPELFGLELFIPVCGFFLAMLFPTFQNYLISDFRDELNIATSIFFSGASLGSTILVFLIGPLNDLISEKYGIVLVIVYLIALIPLFRSIVKHGNSRTR